MKTFSGLARQSLTAACFLLAFTTLAQAQTARTLSARASQDNQNVCTTGEREQELFEAIERKNSARVDALLASGVSPNAHAVINYESFKSTRFTCATALMHAARAGDEKIVASLLAAKADVSALDNWGRFIWGYVFGAQVLPNIPFARLQDELTARLQITKRLIAAGAKLEVKDWWDGYYYQRDGALLHATATGVLTGDLRILQTVISSGASVKNNEVLAYATRVAQSELGNNRAAPGSEQVIRTLLDAGADVNGQLGGSTALMMEADGWWYAGAVERIKVLLASGADVNAQDSTGATALLTAIKHLSFLNIVPYDRQEATAHVWVEVVKLFLAARADPNKSDKQGNSPLPASFQYEWFGRFPSDCEAVFKALIAAGADLNSRDAYGDSLLSHAASQGAFFNSNYQPNSLQLLKNLIAAGADVNLENKEGRTPLQLAASARGWNDAQPVRALLAAGAVVNHADKSGMTPLMAALASQENPNPVHLLIEARANVNARNREGDTVLTLALQYASAETIRTLIAAGADVNLTNDVGEQPLIVAVKRRREDEVIQMLLGAGARIDSTNALGDTALMVVAKAYDNRPYYYPSHDSSDERLIKTLITAGADVTLLNHEGESALTILVTKSGPEALPSIRALLEAASRKSARDYPRAADLLIAIRRAAGNSPADVVQELIKAGADVNAADESGRPALLIAAAESGNPAVVRALVAAGARVNTKNKEGDTALIAAVREYLPVGDEFIQNALHRNTEVVRLLLEAGADPRQRGRDGQSAIKLADKSGNQTLIGMIEKSAQH